LQKEIEKVLGDQPCYNNTCMQLGQPMMKIDRSNKTMIAFMVILAVTFVLL